MKLVIDASAAVAVCLSKKGYSLLREDLHAPVLLRSEVLSALQGLLWRREISSALADIAVDRLLNNKIHLVRRNAIYREAKVLARRLGWAKTYDAEYVALAQLIEAPLLTLDQRLARRIHRLVDVLHPSDL